MEILEKEDFLKTENEGQLPYIMKKYKNESEESGELEIIDLVSLQQYINRYDKLPPELEISDVFRQISYNLNRIEVECRQSALRILYEVLPKVTDDLDTLMRTTVLPVLIINLGHIMPTIRKHALDVIIAYVKCSAEPEFILRSIITQGIDSPVANSSLTLNIIRCIPIILKTVSSYSSSDAISHQTLVHIVTSLAKRMVQVTHQEQVVYSLINIKNIIGDSKFDHFLETYYPQVKRDFDMFCQVYNSTEISDVSDEPLSESSISNVITTNRQDSSIDDDTLIKDDDDSECDGSKFDKDEEENSSENINLITEINVQNKLCKTEDVENLSSENDVIMKVYDEEGNEIKRNSSRRVTFGGEIVKIRTPDSEGTIARNFNNEKLDITANITIQISSDEGSIENVNEFVNRQLSIPNVTTKKHTTRKSRSSHIPLPINPALNRPKDPRCSFRQPSTASLDSSFDKQFKEYEELSEIPIYDGESLTSSSDSSDRCKGSDGDGSATGYMDYAQKEQVLINNTLIDLTKLKISDRIILENLFRKDDWHLYIRGLDRLAVTLLQPQVVQSLSGDHTDTTIGVSLLCYLLNGLFQTRSSQRVTSSILRTLRSLNISMLPKVLNPYLITLVPAICKYLSPSYNTTVRLEAVESIKMLMQKLSPNPIVNVLFTEQCFFSQSSKMRENSLLCLMYGLITFPSTEFNIVLLTDILIKHSIQEPKRGVRQALLDTLSILAQFLPRSQFKVESLDPDAVAFKKALQARLTRRQLPSVHPDGLILYAFQISPSTTFGTDIEWILNGRGSLSLNSCRTQGNANYLSGDNSTSKCSNWIVQSNNRNMTVNGSASTLYCHPRNDHCSLTEETNDREIQDIRHNDEDGEDAEWINVKNTQYSGNAFPRLGPAYEPPDQLHQKETRFVHMPYNETSKLPIRYMRNEHKQSPYTNYNLDISFPTLSMYSLNRKFISSNKNYETRNQDTEQFVSDNDKRNNWLKKQEYTQSFQPIQSVINDARDDGTYLFSNNNVSEKNETADMTDYVHRDNSSASTQNEETPETTNMDSDSNETYEKPATSYETSPLYSGTLSKEHEDMKQEKQDEPKKLISPQQIKSKKKPDMQMKRSLKKQIKIPQNNFRLNPETLSPFEQPKDGICKVLLQLESNEWETIIQGLQGVVRLTRYHSKQLAPSLHAYVIAVSKHVRNLRSQVARAACVSAESIFKYMNRISDQDIEEMAGSLFSRTADTNKFLREDSNKALDVMIDNVKLSKCIISIIYKASTHPSAVVRCSASSLLTKLIKSHGALEIISLTKESRDLLLNTAVKFLMDPNLDTRKHAKDVFASIGHDKRLLAVLAETVPSNSMNAINKSLCRITRR